MVVMEKSSNEGIYVEDSFSNGWIVRQSTSRPGRCYYSNIYSNEKSWGVPASLERTKPDTNAVHSSLSKTESADSIESNEIGCDKFGTFEQTREHLKQVTVCSYRYKEWSLKEIDSSIFSCNRYSEKILNYYKKNAGVIFDFSLLPAPAVVNETVVANMSSKRRAVESSETDRESASHKRARRHASSASDTHGKECDTERLSAGELELLKSVRKTGHSPKETASRLSISPKQSSRFLKYGSKLNTSTGKSINEASKSSSPTNKAASYAQKATVWKEASWYVKQRDDASTPSPEVSIKKSFSFATATPLPPKTLSTEVKVNSAQHRLNLLQQKLKKDQESKDPALGKSPSCASVTPKASLNRRLIRGADTVPQVTNSEITIKAAQESKSSVAVTYKSPQPVESSKRRFSDNLLKKLPERESSKKKLNEVCLSKIKESCPENKPSCSSVLSGTLTKTKPSISYGSSSSSKKNLAAERMERLQLKLGHQSASISAAHSSASPKICTVQKQTHLFVQPGFAESASGSSKVQSYHEPSRFESVVVPYRVDFTETNDSAFEEQMEWEPTDHQLNEMITDIHEVRSEIKGSSLIPFQSSSNDVIISSNEKSHYFIVLDSNILIGHLKLVEALRDRQFQALEPLVLILPWVVIQELDKLKDWQPNRLNAGHSAMTSSLARTAVKWINFQLQAKHPRVKGQTSFKRTGPMMACSMADDSILVCCKEMEPFARHVVLLTEDVNLRNKALMLDIQVRSQSQLKTQLDKLSKRPLSCSSSSKSSTVSSRDDLESQRAVNVLAESFVSPEEAEKSDAILCEVKLCVRNYLDEVAKIELEAAYGKKWTMIVKVPPPWLGMVEVVQVVVDLWRAVFGYACHDRGKLALFEELRAFLRDEKAYNHSLKEVRRFIGTCIEAVRALPNKSSGDILEGCVKLLKQLQDHCENLHAKAAIVNPLDISKDIPVIEKPLEKAWSDLWVFCFASCEFLGIKHDIPVPPQVVINHKEVLDLDYIKTQLVEMRKLFSNLIFSLNNVLNIPVDQVSASNKSIQDLHGILTQLSLKEVVGEYPSIKVFAAYCANESCSMSAIFVHDDPYEQMSFDTTLNYSRQYWDEVGQCSFYSHHFGFCR